LDLSDIHVGDGIAQALATYSTIVRGASLWGLFRLTLRTLNFVRISHEHVRYLVDDEDSDEVGLPSPSVKRDRTEAVVDMLLTNQQVDQIPFDELTCDQDLWNTLVVPGLECNLYRKRFVPSERSRYRQRALPSWQEPWLV
jgi:hypothetical protein